MSFYLSLLAENLSNFKAIIGVLWLNQLILERNPSVLIVNKLSYPDGIPNSSTKELVTKQDIICTTTYLLLLNENPSHNHCAVSGKGDPLYCVISALWDFTSSLFIYFHLPFFFWMIVMIPLIKLEVEWKFMWNLFPRVLFKDVNGLVERLGWLVVQANPGQ